MEFVRTELGWAIQLFVASTEVTRRYSVGKWAGLEVQADFTHISGTMVGMAEVGSFGNTNQRTYIALLAQQSRGSRS